MTDDFFEERKAWSKWKHQLLRRFLGLFSGIVGSAHKTLYYVDGFAGEGRYKTGEDGSPIIAARIATDSVERKRNYTLRCINVEPETYDQLCASTSEFDPSLIENRRGTFGENLDAILAAAGNHPAVFFLDPFGYKGMEWDVVERVAKRSSVAITDLLLNFYVTKIDVHGGYLHSPTKQAPAFRDNLDRTFGTTEWRSIWDSTTIQEERIRGLTMLYVKRLMEAFSGAHGWGASAKYEIKTIDGALKYTIVYGTRHPRGARAMSEVVYGVSMSYQAARNEAARMAEESAPQLVLFKPDAPPTDDQIDDAIVSRLKVDIVALGKGKRFNLAALEEALLVQWFGRAASKHYRRARVELIAENKALVVGQHRPGKSGRPTIADDDTIELGGGTIR